MSDEKLVALEGRKATKNCLKRKADFVESTLLFSSYSTENKGRRSH